MDPPVRSRMLEDASLPGTTPSLTWTINNHSLQFTYRTHIPKNEYTEWFRKVIMPAYCPEGELVFIKLAHETADIIDPYDHTHVVFQTKGAPLRTGNRAALDWKKMPNGPSSEFHLRPRVRILGPKKVIDAARYYLGDEDQEHSLAHKQYDRPEKTLELLLHKPSISSIFVAVPRPVYPRYKVGHLIRWQLDVLAIMNNNTDSEAPLFPSDSFSESDDYSIPVPGVTEEAYSGSKVHVVCDFNGGAGKKCFYKALKYNEPDRFIVIQGIPNCQGFTDIIAEAKSSGWNNDTIIINSNYQQTHVDMDNNIGGIITIANIAEYQNLWILTNVVPRLDVIAPRCWMFYKISANWSTGIVSPLIPISYEQASFERMRQEKYISGCSILPREQY